MKDLTVHILYKGSRTKNKIFTSNWIIRNDEQREATPDEISYIFTLLVSQELIFTWNKDYDIQIVTKTNPTKKSGIH